MLPRSKPASRATTTPGIAALLLMAAVSAQAQDNLVPLLTIPREKLQKQIGAQTVRLLAPQELSAIQAANARLLSSAAMAGTRRELKPGLDALIARPRPRQYLNSSQTPPRSQGSRGTCCVFATLAAVEAAYKRTPQGDLDLSEEFLNRLKNQLWMSEADFDKPSQNDAYVSESLPDVFSAGLGVNGIFQLLQTYRVPVETQLPYTATSDYENLMSWPAHRGFFSIGPDPDHIAWPQSGVNNFNFSPSRFVPMARDQATYGIKRFVALTESEYRNPDFLMALLASGKEIAFAMRITDEQDGRVPEFQHKDDVSEPPGHAMLMVGYDADRRFFIVKNSWGASRRTEDGLPAEWRNYWLVGFDALTDLGEAGYVDQVETIPVSPWRERMLGLWRTTIKQKSTGRVLKDGTFAWRHMIAESAGTDSPWTNRPSFRVGDYHDFLLPGIVAQPAGAVVPAHQSYRVNGVLQNGLVTFYIDFDRPGGALPYWERRGYAFTGSVRNSLSPTPRFASASVQRGSDDPATTRLFGVPLTDIEMVAERVR